LADVLRRPKIVTRFAITEEKAVVFVNALQELAHLVPGALDLEAVPDDFKDNHIVACAVEGGAAFLVSGDHHLTKLKQ
jgi:putative PIN family toxin of toxin-antitoxin system